MSLLKVNSYYLAIGTVGFNLMVSYSKIGAGLGFGRGMK